MTLFCVFIRRFFVILLAVVCGVWVPVGSAANLLECEDQFSDIAFGPLERAGMSRAEAEKIAQADEGYRQTLETYSQALRIMEQLPEDFYGTIGITTSLRSRVPLSMIFQNSDFADPSGASLEERLPPTCSTPDFQERASQLYNALILAEPGSPQADIAHAILSSGPVLFGLISFMMALPPTKQIKLCRKPSDGCMRIEAFLGRRQKMRPSLPEAVRSCVSFRAGILHHLAQVHRSMVPLIRPYRDAFFDPISVLSLPVPPPALNFIKKAQTARFDSSFDRLNFPILLGNWIADVNDFVKSRHGDRDVALGDILQSSRLFFAYDISGSTATVQFFMAALMEGYFNLPTLTSSAVKQYLFSAAKDALKSLRRDYREIYEQPVAKPQPVSSGTLWTVFAPPRKPQEEWGGPLLPKQRAKGAAPSPVAAEVSESEPEVLSLPLDSLGLAHLQADTPYQVVFLRPSPLTLGHQTIFLSSEVVRELQALTSDGHKVDGVAWLKAIQMGLARSEGENGIKYLKRKEESPLPWEVKILQSVERLRGRRTATGAWEFVEFVKMH